MKYLIAILTAVTVNAFVIAQSPEKISYQAIIRNSSDALVVNTQIGMQISILHESASGTPVYVETHAPLTNANGLVSIEIGEGTVVEGSFTSIDWASGPYFIKTETDPSGGTAYTITGISQLLSVPYALHAKTAETISGGITETDPVFDSSEASNITSNDLINLSNLSGKNSGDQDISGIASNSEAIKDTAAQIRASIPEIQTYKIGDFAHGGIVIWLDETGKHGIVCAKEDQSAGVRWYAGTYGTTHAKGMGPLAGKANTIIIITSLRAIGDDGATYAARICNELQVIEGGKKYGDWFLPSDEVLTLMYENKGLIDAAAVAHGGTAIAAEYYWSSRESYYNYAVRLDFSTGYNSGGLKGDAYRVRAVRTF